MALTDIALCSRALLKLGSNGVASFDEGTVETEVAANLYPSVRDSLLSAHPWSFATGQASLPRLSASPLADHAHAFQLPVDFLRALSAGVGERGRGLRYRIAEKRLHTDSGAVVLTYIFRSRESEFPPFFDTALIARLAAEFCIPITDSASRADVLMKLAENEFRRAKTIDSQQDTPIHIDDFALVEARR